MLRKGSLALALALFGVLAVGQEALAAPSTTECEQTIATAIGSHAMLVAPASALAFEAMRFEQLTSNATTTELETTLQAVETMSQELETRVPLLEARLQDDLWIDKKVVGQGCGFCAPTNCFDKCSFCACRQAGGSFPDCYEEWC